MADTPNGLASMTQARERRARRVMPTPRHPVPAGNAESAQPEPDQPALPDSVELGLAADVPRVEVATDAVLPTPARRAERPARPVTRTKPEAVTAGGQAAQRPATLYLDDNLLEFLEEARIAGLLSRPRLDISKSAVVRLALRRLKEEMTIQEIHDHLRAQPTDPTKTGRKRR